MFYLFSFSWLLFPFLAMFVTLEVPKKVKTEAAKKMALGA
jgi:hypothetical protein